ncbi:MAG: PKD domain-containing protein [Planctomycetota bacterium]|nr:PKD domain-containing protein [Planctomycetota bacterium]
MCRLRAPTLLLFLIPALLALGGAARANEAPLVEAGEDQTITLPETANLNGVVSDPDAGPEQLSIQWTLLSGPGHVTFSNQDAPNTTATFDNPGTYVLQLRAFDGAAATADTVTIVVGPKQVPATLTRATFSVNRTTLRANFTFLFYGGNLGANKLDLRPGDVFAVRFGGDGDDGNMLSDGVLIGEVAGPPGADFFSMNNRGRIFTSNGRGETFDSTNASFRGARMAYNPRGLGRVFGSATGTIASLDDLLGAIPAPGTSGFYDLPVSIRVFRLQDGEPFNVEFTSTLRIRVIGTTRAVVGRP